MIAFLDFEASSLSDASWPVEVAWVFEDGRSEAHLIRPLAAWTDWDPEAEAIHGIPLRTLQEDGLPPAQVAARAMAALSGHDLYATAPSWDGKWLSVLLRAGGFPRHALRVRHSDEAHLRAAGEDPDSDPATCARLFLARLRQTQRETRPAHRALPDARQELRIWLSMKRLAQAARSRRRRPGSPVS